VYLYKTADNTLRIGYWGENKPTLSYEFFTDRSNCLTGLLSGLSVQSAERDVNALVDIKTENVCTDLEKLKSTSGIFGGGKGAFDKNEYGVSRATVYAASGVGIFILYMMLGNPLSGGGKPQATFSILLWVVLVLSVFIIYDFVWTVK
jgi:hypothetical protein